MRRLPIPPFTNDTALEKVRRAEVAWNSGIPKNVAELCSPDCIWRNREDLFQGRAAIKYFLRTKWTVQLHTQVMKELWASSDNRISVRFECEWQHARTSQWYRSYGNEHWEFDADGYMTRRDISAYDIPISTNERRFEL